ncbi:MAG: hypothetical protein GY804_11645 [Alphaproteobacteria bacterium]|nr:hypothetical protein [Alphaproteobacteria bacterium]
MSTDDFHKTWILEDAKESIAAAKAKLKAANAALLEVEMDESADTWNQLVATGVAVCHIDGGRKVYEYIAASHDALRRKAKQSPEHLMRVMNEED